MLEGGAQRQRMRRTDGVDADGLAGPVAAHEHREVPSRGLLRLDGKQGRGDEGQHDAGDLEWLRDQAQEREREQRGNERKAPALVSGDTTMALP